MILVGRFTKRASFAFSNKLTALNSTNKLISFQNTKRFNTSQVTMSLPTIPTRRISAAGLVLEDKLHQTGLKIEHELGNNEEDRDESFRAIRLVSSSNQDLLQLIRKGDLSRASAVIEDNKRILLDLLKSIGNDVAKRESKLSFHLERLGTAQLLIDFFSTGKLSSPTSIPVCNDEEYIAACIGWAQELSRYSSMRAIEGDISSVEIVRSALTELHQLLLNFDFRNGQLRRRYDGMKYFVKSVEDTTYELSLLPECTSLKVFHDTLNSVGASASITASAATENATSENATAESLGTIWNYVDGEAFSAIQQRMAAYDAQREQVMKESRDVQKWSKQAVFSILRGQSPDARQKLSKASKSIERLFVIINRFPALRPGAFGNSLEEWCEAQMLLDWCERKVIPDIAELPHHLNASEYIGGLSDFTGELGRLAVMMAAKREVEAVKEIMEVDSLIYDCISRVNNLGGNFNKKLEAVQSNMKKVEDLVLEMSILERTGRVKKRMRIGEDSSSAPGPGNSIHEV